MTGRGKHTERRFEDAITIELCARGFIKGDPETYDAEHALFPHDIVDYIKVSQAKKWQSLVDLQGEAAQTILLDALVKELAAKGVPSPPSSLHLCRKCWQPPIAAYQRPTPHKRHTIHRRCHILYKPF